MEFHSITEATKLVGKSEATIKRMIKTVKEKRPADYANTDFFKFEKLPTGHTKTLINGQYLNDYFNGATNSTNSSANSSTNGSSDELPQLYKDMFEVMKNELEVKNQQIQALQERLREANILALESTRKENLTLLEQPKTRKWWRF